ncbi:hypothetical protein F8A90_13160 [Cobetia sp. cqz5-12]|uniref:hypothetical protein n=1 Tax=unclassified Cobetia TaxID=2609414 RepID=UPI00140CA436|nr:MULTISPECIES: hypothetical protein [unclassified Cobetia]QQK64965.1 hypothetical protein F8A90_13160 [Cobetia sp. cqz5-12]
MADDSSGTMPASAYGVSFDALALRSSGVAAGVIAEGQSHDRPLDHLVHVKMVINTSKVKAMSRIGKRFSSAG